MKREQRTGGPGAGPLDPGLAQRVEGLVDEAVALAAKGSYRDAASRAQEASSLDPDHPVARDLVESYRRLAEDDDERRRRRRSIAAAAAAIEEMIEAGRLEEAATAVEALSMQYGIEAPVDELRSRIAVARANDEGFEELDAAIDAIRRPGPSARSAHPPARLDAVGTLAAEIEDYLRSGRLEEASGRLDKLETMPGSEQRLHKLRTRIEEARHVAEEHRREEEILIATAAIEERLRRGSIDDAAERLEALAARHGSSAPVAELRERLEEARDRLAAGAAPATASSPVIPTHALPDAPSIAAAPVAIDPTAELAAAERELEDWGAGLTYETGAAASGRRKWIAVAAVIALAAGGIGWWISRRTPAPAPSGAAEPGAIVSPAEPGADAPETLHPNAADPPNQAPPVGAEAASDTVRTDPPSVAVPPADPASATAAGTDRETTDPTAADDLAAVVEDPSVVAPATTGAEEAAEAGARLSDPTAPPVEASTIPADPSASPADEASTADDGSRSQERAPADASPASTDQAAEASPPEGRTEVVMEALPAGAENTAPATEDRSAPAEELAPPATRTDEPPAAPRTEAAPEPVAPAEEPARPAAPTAAPPPTTRTSILGCGEAGVVCVKLLRVPQPSYPAAARQRRLSARVNVLALVDETGRVIQTRIEDSSFAFFNDAAIEAANRAVFQPASRGGIPGRSWARLSFQFTPR